MRTIILGSSSPYRRELLDRLKIEYTVVSPEIDETPLASELPEDTALRLAELKAKKVGETHQNALIIGCDQVATLDGKAIGKPGNHANAVLQLQAMRGREVIFYSAICLLDSAQNIALKSNVMTTVKFRSLSDKMIDNYLKLEQPYDCAGSAKIEKMGIILIEKIVSDDPTAIIGLPLIRLIDYLQTFDINPI